MNITADLDRFLRYVKVDTQSDDTSDSCPSQAKELNLTYMLKQELDLLGIPNYVNEYGILYGKLEGEPDLEPIGLNSHVDTALELSGKDVQPRIIENYDGGTIVLNDKFSMSPEDFPTLGDHIGDTLVVTNGDTLLGADDKAGIAIIMAVLTYYKMHPEVKHHTICFCFTPDEEIGRGADHFDAEAFGAKYAYTIDGGNYLEIAIESFNAAHADVHIQGLSIHPGEAKGKLASAVNLAIEYDGMLSPRKRPQYTCEREGFYHLTSLNGNVDEAHMHYIIRHHEKEELIKMEDEMIQAMIDLRERYPAAKIDVTLGEDYRNMAEVFQKHPEAVEKAKKAFKSLGFFPVFPPIRGGTDGATFSFKGCPTPNLGTGSYNHHGRYEYLSVTEFYNMIEIVKEIMKADVE